MKKFRFSIGKKLGLGFGILLVAILFNIFTIHSTLEKNRDVNRRISEVYSPSASALHDLQFLINNSKMLIKNWVFIEKKENTPDKIRLRNIHSQKYPQLKDKLVPLVSKWEKDEQKLYEQITNSIDTLFGYHQRIMEQLSSFDQYENPMVIFETRPRVDEDGDVTLLTDRILQKLNTLVAKHEAKVKKSNQKMNESFALFERLILMMGLLLVVGVLVIATLTTRAIVRPIRSIKRVILMMGKGILPKEKLKSRSDEIGQMAEALNILISGLRETSKFSMEIGKGNFSSEFTPLSQDDLLGNSLIKMRENLKKAAEEDTKRKKEDAQRNWSSEGVAKFSELLRQNNDNMTDFSNVVIKNLVRYLEANQGAIFIINDENMIELTAAFAYERRRSLEKQIQIGEGIVGRCVQENETIYMTDIPENYINITSGLGQDTPGCLLVVPLKLNEEVFGVVEIASFKEFGKYQVDFVEKIGESIASTIQRVKINISTSKLLKESEDKSNRLAEQEEEMRQSIEEMQAAQEQTMRNHEDEKKLIRDEYEERILKLRHQYEDQIEAIKKEALGKNDQ